MSLTLDLEGRTVVVTGGVRGVGAGISRAFLEAGADVVAVARREPDSVPEAGGRTARFVSLDVRDPDAVQDFADDLDRADVLVNNAGGAPYLPVADGALRTHVKIMELNLTAPLIMARALRPLIMRRGGGSVINIGSVSGVRPSPGTAAYGAAKAGLHNLTQSLAVEWAPHIRVNTLILGMVRTELAHLHYGDEDGIAAVARTVPLGRLADPYDIGAACVFLASDLASYVTGSSMQVHGGGERPAFLDAATVNKEETR
ncbi:SDR family oxidoreductase [Actinomadura citrea]|jgi:NAD(P)-dependent dehydrogenase (short-subunit alcohol dehydrogenase family)|uniref:NAD(P)-dependent dehydrogenase (Short-subunit alcohol dehydrogenase family) n=1 Tax=Actinomadura citrea TaxID=46158 RepID=A0A7Y9KDD0_9ACTN|nr:SDR family oxidoreductase [Actinomadura citrea]NYE13285.1 NAD(P)-dependent dehydrogenase (short-subunit alcohol dehydrogenase family) [Actinomadura citrea]GGU05843.1 putative short-chain dehydrogenase/reductase [Actinomadura citrea]